MVRPEALPAAAGRPTPRGRPPRDVADQRLEVLFRVAFDEFATHGFGGTNLNRLVKLSGVSKTTIFRRFGSKEGLFLSLIERSAGELRQATRSVAMSDDEPRAYLLAVAQAIQSDAGGLSSGLLRLAIAENARFPDLGSITLTATRETFRPLADYFAGLMARGLLRRADAMELCFDFVSLLSHGFRFMLEDKDTVFERERLEREVDRFLKGWA